MPAWGTVRARGLGILVLMMVVGLLLVGGPPSAWLSTTTFDAYQTLAPRQRASAPVVIVAIDDGSITRHGQWPWPRTLLARLIQRVADADPAVIGLDVIMPEADRLSPGRLPALVPDLGADVVERLMRLPSNDAVLADTLRRTRVVAGVAALDSDPSSRGRGGWAAMRVYGDDPRSSVRRFIGELRSIEQIDRAATSRAILNIDGERGAVRRVPLIAAVGDTLVPGFGIELLRVGTGESALGVHASGPRGVQAVSIGDLRVPTAPDGSLVVHYTRHDPARFVSAADVLGGTVSPQEFTRKVVLVGVTAVGLSDYQETPVVDRMPSVEIHAQAIENIFDRTTLTRPAWARWVEVAILAVAGAVVVLLVPILDEAIAVAMVLGLTVIISGLGFGLYVKYRVLVDAAAPATGIALTFFTVMATVLADTRRQRRMLGRQVAAQRDAAARIAGELEAARRIQQGLLPSPRVFEGERRIDVYGALESAREVGGDLYDFFRLDDDRVFFLVGDVAGKGLPASTFMAVSKALCKSTALRTRGDLGTIISDADAEISRENPEALFVTVWAGILDLSTGELQYCAAGHEAALRRSALSARWVPLDLIGGPALCAIEGFSYVTARYKMEPGETLCLFTDGVTEAMNGGGEMYGRTRLVALLDGLPADAAVAVVGETVRKALADFVGDADRADDVTVLVLRWHGPARS